MAGFSAASVGLFSTGKKWGLQPGVRSQDFVIQRQGKCEALADTLRRTGDDGEELTPQSHCPPCPHGHGPEAGDGGPHFAAAPSLIYDVHVPCTSGDSTQE